MAVRKILTIPDPVLRKKSDSVKTIDKDIKNLMDDMLQTMYDAPGIGLAAIQIGVPKRVVVMDLSKDTECSLEQSAIDQMTFSESFKYSRECNGKDSMFTWKGNEYSALLASEVIPSQDKVAEEPKKSVDKRHLALQQQILDVTIGNK